MSRTAPPKLREIQTPPAIPPRTRQRRSVFLNYLVWLPIPLFTVIIAVLFAADIRTRFEPRYLFPELNILFLSLVSWIVAYLAARSFLARGTPAVLFLGCGMLVLGCACAVAGVFGYLRMDADVVTVHNSGALLSGLFILISALTLTGGSGSKSIEGSAGWLLACYLASLGAILVITVGALKGYMPLFFKAGEGATLLRQAVLFTALLEFSISSVIFAAMYQKSHARFLRWYSAGLGLFAIGLAGLIPQVQLGTPISWAARLAQYLGGVYLLQAVLAVYRQYHTWGIPAGRALHELERRHHRLVELCPDAILVHSEGKYVYANPAAARLFGARSPEDVIGMNVLDLVAPSFRSLKNQRIQQAYADGMTPLQETRFVRFDGLEIQVESTGARVEFRGRPAIQIVVRDITERKHAEEALRHSEERYRKLVEMSPEAVFVNRDNMIVFLNPAALQLFGASTPQQILGKSPFDMFHPEYHAVMQERIAWARAGDSVPLIEGRILRLDGSIREVEVAASSFTDEEGAAIQVILRDITERKQAMEALMRSERLYRAIGESIDYGVWVCAPDGRNIYASESFLKMVGLTQEQCSNFGWGEVLHPDDAERTIAAWKQCVQTGGTWDIEHRFWGVDGQWHDVLARGVPVRDEQGEITSWAGINVDISRLKRAEEELRQAKDQLDLRVQERTEQLSGMIDKLNVEVIQRTLAEQSLRERSEQLRLLASELTLAEQRERQRLAQVLHDGLQQILVGAKFRLALMQRAKDKDLQKATSEVSDLIDDAIETSRSLTAELSPPILHECGLVPALEWLARWMQDKHGLILDLKAQTQTDPIAEDVKVLLFQATRELLFNVVKHAGVKTARVQVYRPGGQIQITVADEGAGFDPTQLRTAGGHAGGFGLFSVRERLHLLGGQMQIDSAPGRGSSITLVAPASTMAKHAGAAPAEPTLKVSVGLPAPPKAAATDARNKIRVLVVDDHIVMRQGLASLLRETPDIEIVGEASEGEAAVKLVRELLPDVILMDISLAGMNGIQATQIIHSEWPRIRIIGLSMFEEGVRAAAIRAAGAVGYLTKSGPSEDVIRAIRTCVQKHDQKAQTT
jgi:PAS domain S-box-containing protein